MKQCNTPNGMGKKSALIPLSEIYILRVFHWEDNEYYSWLYFDFGESWLEFTDIIEDIGAVFTGGMITPDGHYYLAQTEEYCIQLCPFITDFDDDTETEEL